MATQKIRITKKLPTFEHQQLKVFILCWAAYASAYFCRVNLSIAIPSIQQSFGWSKASLGLMGGSFFWVYGIGQLINGYIGDKFPGRIFIFVGLVVSSIVNIIFGFASTIALMVFLWVINGAFQSMLWSPIVRILSQWFPKEQNTRVSVGISTSMIGGFLLAWGFNGQVLKSFSWNWVFIIPGITVLLYGFIWLIAMEKNPPNTHFTNNGSDVEDIPIDGRKPPDAAMDLSFLDFIGKNKLWILAIACVAQGAIKDGISLWGPAYLMETHALDLTSTTSYILLIPIMNFGGMLLAGWLNKKFNYNYRFTILALFGASVSGITGLFIFGQYDIIMGVVLLGTSSAMMYGANTLLLGVIPLEFADYNKTSTVAGFLNFSCYMGAGASGVMIGGASDHWGWNGILIIWICMALLGMASIWRSRVSK